MAEEGGIFGAFLIFGLIVVGYLFCYCYQKLRQTVYGPKEPKQEPVPPPELPPFPFTRMTTSQLRDYDGTRRDGRILIAFKGKIYDVSAGLEEFSPKGVLGCMAGKNFSEYLERTLQPRETVVDYINRWDTLLAKNYPIVGALIGEEEIQENLLNNSEQGNVEESLKDIDHNDNTDHDNDDDNENDNDNNITFLDSSDVQVIESTFEDDDDNNTVIEVQVGKVQMKDMPDEAKIQDTPETPLSAAITEKTC